MSVESITEQTSSLNITPAAVESTPADTPTDAAAAAAASSEPAAAAAEPITDAAQIHPLQNQWTFFYNPPQKPSANGEWSSNVKPVTDFSSVEDFWRLFNALKSPSQLTIGSNYHMFKKGIQPEWEDEQNKRGGKWTIALPRRGGADATVAKQADDAWLYTLLALIGEQFGADSDEICGVVIGPRNKETRLALWTKTGDDEALCKRIGAFFKQNVRHEQAISYQLHDESIKKQTSYRNETVYKV